MNTPACHAPPLLSALWPREAARSPDVRSGAEGRELTAPPLELLWKVKHWLS